MMSAAFLDEHRSGGCGAGSTAERPIGFSNASAASPPQSPTTNAAAYWSCTCWSRRVTPSGHQDIDNCDEPAKPENASVWGMSSGSLGHYDGGKVTDENKFSPFQLVS